MIQGSEDEAVKLEFAEKSRDVLLAMNLNVNFTVLAGEPHVIVNTRVISSIESFIAKRAVGTTEYLKKLVQDLTDTFGSLSNRLNQVPKF